MFLSPARTGADRLAALFMSLVRALVPATRDGTPTLERDTALTLFYRLQRLVIFLVRITNRGLPARRKPTPPPRPGADPDDRLLDPDDRLLDPDDDRHPDPVPRLPSRRAWLVAALPDAAPAIAADLAALLADPAVATLLRAVPSLQRTLRPLLRSLGLTLILPERRPPPPRPPLPHPTTLNVTPRTTPPAPLPTPKNLAIA